MPFTAAHPAAVVPLAGPLSRFTCLSGLVVGSVAPDLPYFVPGLPWKSIGHSPAGLFLFDIPAGLLLYAAFHSVLAPLLYALAPAALRARLPRSRCAGALPARGLLVVVASLLVGAATHLAWDAFTHADGAVVLQLPVLSSEILTWQGYTVYVYKVLQHGSTFVGLALLGYWLARWYRRAHASTPPAPPSRLVRTILASSVLIPSSAAAAVGASLAREPDVLVMRQLQLGAAGAIHLGAAALLVTSLSVASIWRIVSRRAG